MSPIGKVFVVLNLVFSLVLLGVVGGILAMSDEYKGEYERVDKELKTERQNFEQERTNIAQQLEQAQRQRAIDQEKQNQLQVEINELRSTNERLTVDNQQLRDALTKLQTDYQTFTSTLSELQSHNQQLVARSEELMTERTSAVDAQRAAEEAQARLSAEVSSLQRKIEQMQQQIQTLEAERGDLTSQLDAAISRGFDVASLRPAPEIHGVIQNVNPKLGLVVLSVGGDDGVTRGTRFEVYGGGEYKGQVVVEDVYPDNSAARIVRKAEGRDIVVMDRASTRL